MIVKDKCTRKLKRLFYSDYYNTENASSNEESLKEEEENWGFVKQESH